MSKGQRAPRAKNERQKTQSGLGLGACNTRGPGGAKCTYLAGHAYAHYDAVRQVSFVSKKG